MTRKQVDVYRAIHLAEGLRQRAGSLQTVVGWCSVTVEMVAEAAETIELLLAELKQAETDRREHANPTLVPFVGYTWDEEIAAYDAVYNRPPSGNANTARDNGLYVAIVGSDIVAKGPDAGEVFRVGLGVWKEEHPSSDGKYDPDEVHVLVRMVGGPGTCFLPPVFFPSPLPAPTHTDLMIPPEDIDAYTAEVPSEHAIRQASEPVGPDSFPGSDEDSHYMSTRQGYEAFGHNVDEDKE